MFLVFMTLGFALEFQWTLGDKHQQEKLPCMLQRWSDSVFLLSDPILFLKNDIRIRSESCFGWKHTIRIRKLSKSVLWCTTIIFMLCLFCLM